MMPQKALEYYKFKTVAHEIARQLFNRELFLKDHASDLSIRPLRIFSPDGWLYHVDRFQFAERQYSVFHSVATLKFNGFPNPPTELDKLKEYRELFFKNYDGFISGYDFVIDADLREDYAKGFEAVKKIHSAFTDRQLPFIMNFSGRGFHFRIKWEDIKEELQVNPREMPPLCKRVITGLIADINSKLSETEQIGIGAGKTIDYIYDLARVFRCLYSIHPLVNKVVLPLSDAQFYQFSPEICELQYVLDNTNLFQRGDLKRRGEKGSISKLFKDYGELNEKEN